MSEEASEAGSRWLSREISGGPERITARAAFVRALVGGSHSGSFIRALSFDEGASRMARGADGAGLSGTAARQRMTQVFAAQPYTRSITPRYGSTARSGSRLLRKRRDRGQQTRSSMGVVKRASTWGRMRTQCRDRKEAVLKGSAAPAVR